MKPRTEAWNAWVRTLKTGDLVTVRHWGSGEAIYRAHVRVTKTGRVLLENSRDCHDWSRGVVNQPGGGDRYISPAPEGAKEGIA